MRVCENGIMRDATAEEIKAMNRSAVKAAQEAKRMPLTEAEVNRMLITRQINSLEVDGNTALRMK